MESNVALRHRTTGPGPGVCLSPGQARRILRQRLKELPASPALSDVALARLSRRLVARRYARGEVILMAGVRGDCLGVVVAGEVALCTLSATPDQPTLLLLPGATFGGAMLVSGAPGTATVRAHTDAQVHYLRRADLLAESGSVRSHHPGATTRWLRGLGVVALALVVANLMLILAPTRQALALVFYGAGLSLDDQGLDDGAVSSLWLVAHQLVPGWAAPHVALGNCYWEQGRLDDARAELEKALALAPDLAEAHNTLGLISMAQGDYAAAREAFEAALTLEPGRAAVEGNLAQSLHESGYPARALDHYTVAASLDLPPSVLLANHAVALFETDDLDGAVAMAEQALGADPSVSPAWTVIGAVELAREHPARAIQSLEEAARFDPTYAPAHFYLGLAYKTLGRPAAAIPAFERALALTDDPIARREARRHLAELYDRYGAAARHRRSAPGGERR